MVHPLGGRRGPARTFDLLAGYLARRDFDVTVVAPPGFLDGSLRRHTGSIRYIPLAHGRWRPWAWLRGVIQLWRLVPRAAPQLIHANCLSALNLAAPVALRLRLPVFVHVHASLIGRRAKVLAHLWQALGLSIRAAPVSRFGEMVLDEAGLRPLIVDHLANPVVATLGDRIHAKPDRPFRIGFVGSCNPQKGLHVLVEIARLLISEDVRWVIVGVDPEDHDPYVQACRASLVGVDSEWLGRVSDMETAYRRMDALLVPSERETGPRVALEAMIRGIPVVGTRFTALQDLLRDASHPMLFDREDPASGAGLLRHLMRSPDAWTDCARDGQRIASHFSLESVGDRLLAIYRKLDSAVST